MTDITQLPEVTRVTPNTILYSVRGGIDSGIPITALAEKVTGYLPYRPVVKQESSTQKYVTPLDANAVVFCTNPEGCTIIFNKDRVATFREDLGFTIKNDSPANVTLSVESGVILDVGFNITTVPPKHSVRVIYTGLTSLNVPRFVVLPTSAP